MFRAHRGNQTSASPPQVASSFLTLLGIALVHRKNEFAMQWTLFQGVCKTSLGAPVLYLGVCLPGPRLIEVYPRPPKCSAHTHIEKGMDWQLYYGCWNFFDKTVGYSWQAHRCECEHNSHSPIVVSQVCRESRRIFKHVEGQYARCFGTYFSWEHDNLYIGDRTGHLYNTEFLKALEPAGGLEKVKNLAIHEDVWVEKRDRHGIRAKSSR